MIEEMGMDSPVLGSCKPSGEEKQHCENLGPFHLVLDSLNLLKVHALTFGCIQLAIVLPTTIVMLLSHCFFDEIAHKFFPFPRPPTPPPAFQDRRPDIRLLVLIGVVLVVLGFALTVNLVSAICYTVSFVNTGKNITFKEVLQALPSQWKGVAVTGLWGQMFFAGTALVLLLAQIGVMMVIDIQRIPLYILIGITFGLSRSGLVFLNSVLQMAYAVTVFENLDGFATFTRAWNLLKYRWYTALGLFVGIEVPNTVLVFALRRLLRTDREIDGIALYMSVVLVVVLASLLMQVSSVSYAIFYTSCGPFMDEENELIVGYQWQLQVGYQRIHN